MRKLAKTGIYILSGYLILSFMLYFIQEKLIFLPSRLPSDYRYEFSLPVEEFDLTTPDGARLNAIHFRNEVPKGVILYFHGNAGDLSRWGTIVSAYADLGYDVIAMDYRTYGKSTGKLSERALYEDGQLFYDYTRQEYPEQSIILFGRSLGTGIATYLAAANKPGQLILETPFYSLMEVGVRRFPFLPVRWLLRYPMKSYEHVRQLSCPVAVFHGTADRIIPIESGKKLFEVIPTEKEFFQVEGGRHNNLMGFETYQRGIRTILSNQLSNRSEDK